MIKHETIRTFRYIAVTAFIISLIASIATVAVNYLDKLYATSITVNADPATKIIFYDTNRTPIEGMSGKALFDTYVTKVEIQSKTQRAFTFFIDTVPATMGTLSPKDTLTIERTFVPINVHWYALAKDAGKAFLLCFIKYIFLISLIIFLLEDKIKYTIRYTMTEQRISVSEAINYRRFLVHTLTSIKKVAGDFISARPLLIGMLLMALTNLPVIIAVVLRQETLHIPLFICYAVNKLLFDPLLYILIVAIVIKITRSRIAAALLCSFMIFLNLADAAIYYFGFTVFERNHISLITPYSLFGFFSWQVVGLILLLISLLIPVNILTMKGVKKTGISKVAILLLVLYGISLPALGRSVSALFFANKPDQPSLRELNDNLSYALQNSFVNFVDEVAVLPLCNHPVNAPKEDFSKTLAYYGIPQGVHKRQLNTPPPQKIVLFTSESMSLDLLSLYNPDIVPDTSGLYGLREIQARTNITYTTTAHNTLQGLICTMNSHPDFSLLAEGSRYRFSKSYIHLLKKHGYKTIFLRSASKYFASEDKIFTALGFDEIIGREDFEKENSTYVNGWGVADRIVYEKLITLLNEYKEQKVFIMVLGTDTHPLDGRKDYFDLKYPFSHEMFSQYPASSYFLNAVAHNTYDMENLYRELHKQGLYDDKTCFIYTADHACPLNAATAGVPGYPLTSLARIPLIIDYAPINPLLYRHKMASQVDFAPTILDIAGIDAPSGYWGLSLFTPNKANPVIGYDQERLYITSRQRRSVINIHHPATNYEAMIARYFRFTEDK